MTAIVLGFFAVDLLRNAPETFVAIVAMTVLAVVLDTVWKRVRDSRPDAMPSPSVQRTALPDPPSTAGRGGRPLAKQLELLEFVAERPEEDALGSCTREHAEPFGAELRGTDRQREGAQRLDRSFQHRSEDVRQDALGSFLSSVM